jgi:hypothetical protein
MLYDHAPQTLRDHRPILKAHLTSLLLSHHVAKGKHNNKEYRHPQLVFPEWKPENVENVAKLQLP